MKKLTFGKVRANEFDAWVGKFQTLKVIELGYGKSILDIGCGVGMFTPMFLKRFPKVVGLDASEKHIKTAQKNNQKVRYVIGWGETFKLAEKFDTISMNNLLEHVKDPIKLLQNAKRHLSPKGRIIVQVPNANSVTRRLGVIMGIIDSISNISEKERKYYGHQRVYTLDSLASDIRKTGLKVTKKGGIFYKPLPNEILLEICKKRGQEWTDKFLTAMNKFGEDKPEDCACLYVVGTR